MYLFLILFPIFSIPDVKKSASFPWNLDIATKVQKGIGLDVRSLVLNKILTHYILKRYECSGWLLSMNNFLWNQTETKSESQQNIINFVPMPQVVEYNNKTLSY